MYYKGLGQSLVSLDRLPPEQPKGKGKVLDT